MNRWQVQEAKARFSEVVKASDREGPQVITVHGRPRAVVLSKTDYDRLTGRKRSFVTFLRKSPLVGARLRIERDRSPSRDVRL